MKELKSVKALVDVEEFIEANRLYAYGIGKSDFWQRDKNWVISARRRIVDGDSVSLKSVLDEIRNLSQSFCSYSSDLSYLDTLLDSLHHALEEDIVGFRT